MAGAFLHVLSDEARAELVRIADRRHWPTGATVFHEGDPADRVVVMEVGIVKAVAASEAGIDSVLALRGPGDILGELAAVGGGSRSATIVAVEPVTALVLSVRAFRDYLTSQPDAATALLAVLADRVRDASRRQVEFGSLDTSVRVARLLAELGTTYGEPTEVGIRVRLLSQDELAGLCAASREAIARSMRTLREAGLIETGRRQVTIRDLGELRGWSPT